MSKRVSFEVSTTGRGTYDITQNVQEAVTRAGGDSGLAHVFVHHTSASVILCENADASVRRDLEAFFARLVPDGDELFSHDAEGDDDMPAHLRTILTSSAVTIPIAGGRCDLGTWQGVYLWEHRTSPHRRKVTVTVLG
jgi:secondary thiamine-phosphate synthase enzyme